MSCGPAKVLLSDTCVGSPPRDSCSFNMKCPSKDVWSPAEDDGKGCQLWGPRGTLRSL